MKKKIIIISSIVVIGLLLLVLLVPVVQNSIITKNIQGKWVKENGYEIEFYEDGTFKTNNEKIVSDTEKKYNYKISGKKIIIGEGDDKEEYYFNQSKNTWIVVDDTSYIAEKAAEERDEAVQSL